MQANGYLHKRVGDGEQGQYQHKATPTLIPDGMFDRKKISRLFQERSRDIDSIIADFVFRKLSEYPL